MTKINYKTTLDFVLKYSFISLECESNDDGESFLIYIKENSTQPRKIMGRVSQEDMIDFFDELEGKLNDNDKTRRCACYNALTTYQKEIINK